MMMMGAEEEQAAPLAWDECPCVLIGTLDVVVEGPQSTFSDLNRVLYRCDPSNPVRVLCLSIRVAVASSEQLLSKRRVLPCEQVCPFLRSGTTLCSSRLARCCVAIPAVESARNLLLRTARGKSPPLPSQRSALRACLVAWPRQRVE